MTRGLEARERIQEEQYELPYHYRDLLTPRPAIEPLSLFELVTEYLCLPPGARVLDVGCGDGRFCYYAKRRYQVVGVDISARALHWARSFNPEVEFHEGFLPELGISGFQGVVCLEVFEHLPDRDVRPMLDAMRRALIPGGKLALSVPSTRLPVSAKHYRHYTEASLRDALSRSGFSAVDVYGYSRTRSLARAAFSVLEAVSLPCHSHAFVQRFPRFTKWLSLARRRLWSSCLRLGDPARCRGLVAVCTRP